MELTNFYFKFTWAWPSLYWLKKESDGVNKTMSSIVWLLTDLLRFEVVFLVIVYFDFITLRLMASVFIAALRNILKIII